MQKKLLKRMAAVVGASALLLSTAGIGLAKPPGAQVFDVYDETQDGLQVGTDPVTGQIEANANPGGASRMIVQVHVQKAAPNCTLDVQLVRGTQATNGGLDATGHTGFTQTIGQLTTNGVGNGNTNIDFDPSADGTPDTIVYGHIDIEDFDGDCTEADGTGVGINEYGAAPDPALLTPFNWLE